MIAFSITVVLLLVVAAVLAFGSAALSNLRTPFRRPPSPNDGLVDCYCSFPDCDRSAFLTIDLLLTDETLRRTCSWGIGPTMCPDHRVPETQAVEGTP